MKALSIGAKRSFICKKFHIGYLAYTHNLLAKRYRSELSTSINETLKYDPLKKDGSFTDYGILPFIQNRLDFIAYKTDSISTVPPQTAGPTADQKSLLSVLNSEFSVVQKGIDGTGKSLALCAFTLNKVLSHVPPFKIMKSLTNHPQVHSVILLPNEMLMKKYDSFFENLKKGIPEICCPSELEFDKDKRSYNIIRKPLIIKYLMGNSCKVTSSAGIIDSKDTPQILVTSPENLMEILKDGRKDLNLDAKNFVNLQFLAVDEFDFFLSTSHISDPKNSNLIQKNKKEKFQNKVEFVIKHIQELSLNNYVSNLKMRLKRLEFKFKEDNKLNFATNRHDHSQIIMNDNKLSLTQVDEFVRKHYAHLKQEERPNSMLLKRLIKQKRMMFYKQIQVCFLLRSGPSLFKSRIQTASSDTQQSPNMNQQNLNKWVKSDRKLNKEFNKFITEKMDSIQRRRLDFYTTKIEKILRFDDSKRFFRSKERTLLSIGSFSGSSWPRQNVFGSISKPEMVFMHINTDFGTPKASVSFENLDIQKHFPSTFEIENYTDIASAAKNNFKNECKNFIRDKAEIICELSSKVHDKILVKRACIILRNLISRKILENDSSSSKQMVVLPPIFSLERIAKKLNKDQMNERSYITFNSLAQKHIYGTGSDDLGTNENIFDKKPIILAHADELIGQIIPDMKEIIVIGFDCLVPELAFSGRELSSSKHLIKSISGIEDPSSDLIGFYLSKFSSPEGNRLIFAFGDIYGGSLNSSLREQKRIAQMIMENDLVNNFDIVKFEDDQMEYETVLPYRTDSISLK